MKQHCYSICSENIYKICVNKSLSTYCRRQEILLQFSALKFFQQSLEFYVSLDFLPVPFSLLPLVGDGMNNGLQGGILKDPFPLWGRDVQRYLR